jgi:K+ transporter
MVATPIGSLLVTLWLSQANEVGWWWNSKSEFEVAAKFASGGILFYTASFAALETGVWFAMVLAFEVIKKYEADRERRRQEREQQRQADIALGAEAERQRQETGESLDEAVARLQAEGWQSAQS